MAEGKKRGDLGARVVALLDDPRVEVRCAAARVLGVAGKGEPAVVKALAARLGDPNPLVRGFVLEALEPLGARGLAKDLLPLLEAGDEETRARAMRLFSAQGAQAESALVRALEGGSREARRQAATLLSKIGSEGAWDALYEKLADPDIGEHVLQLLRAEIDRGDAKLRAVLGRRAVAAVRKLTPKRPRRKTQVWDEAVLARLGAVLRLVGYLADPSTLGLLVEHADRRQPTPLRLAAIAAMRRIVASPSAPRIDKAIARLIEAAEDPDPAIARAAVDTLRGARIPEGQVKAFARLAKSDRVEARTLAMERLPALGQTSVATLLANLSSPDPGARDAAARALAASPEAAGPLAKALAEARDEAEARRLAQALRAHEGRVPKAALEALAERVARRAEDPADRAAGPVGEALARLWPEAYARILFDRAARLRKQKRWTEAFAALRPLLIGPIRLDDEQRFLLGVLGLKAAGKDLLRAARTVDPVLVQFGQLCASGYPVARALLRQKDLDPEDLFTLGFNFVESHDADEKELGRELLEAIVERRPRAKIATAARNKLKLVQAAA